MVYSVTTVRIILNIRDVGNKDNEVALTGLHSIYLTQPVFYLDEGTFDCSDPIDDTTLTTTNDTKGDEEAELHSQSTSGNRFPETIIVQ
jgi:hypothetical protein